MISSEVFEDTVILAGVKRAPYFFLLALTNPLCIAASFYWLAYNTVDLDAVNAHLLAWSYFLADALFGKPKSALFAKLEQEPRQLAELVFQGARYFALLLLVLMFVPSLHDGYLPILLAWSVSSLLMAAVVHSFGLRFLMMRSMRCRPLRVLMGGITPRSLEWARKVTGNPFFNVDVVGFVDGRIKTRDESMDIFERLGDFNDIQRLCTELKVDRIMIGLPSTASARIALILEQAKDTTSSVYQLQGADGFDPVGMRFENIAGIPSVSLIETPSVSSGWFLKTLADRTIALFALIVLAPLFAVLAAWIKLDSKGSAFFRQQRYGMDGEVFHVWKFRSMTQDASASGNVAQATKNDMRVTKVGAFLRKSSLDELPQLLNVLDGTMSLVGPRPHARAHNEHFRKLIPGYMLRHKVKPGMTGLAQIRGFRGETDTLDKMESRIQSDLDYMRNWTFGMDFVIMLRTPLSLIFGKNAY
jgi:putative colanic acid biosysnthesis UDP-glucose lipid carrier transferase